MRPCLLVFVFAACSSYAYREPAPTPRSILAGRINELAGDVAVRHRRVVPLSWLDVSGVVTRGSWFAASPPAPTATLVPSAKPPDPEKLVIEAWIELAADDVTRAATALRARVAADGGRIVSETVLGAGRTGSSAMMEIRVPPAKTAAFTGWLGELGVVASSRALASDVGKTLVDQELELANLAITMRRLQALAERDVPMQALLELEKEMTRVRGDLERIAGERRFLLDRIEFATVTVTIKRDALDDPASELAWSAATHLHPGPHVAVLALLDPGDRRRTHVGGGVALQISRALTIDLDLYPRAPGETRIATSTIGTAVYSGLLGGGHRTWGNPFLGVRAGYGYLAGASSLVVAGELGLELYKQRYVLIEASTRATAFVAGSAEAALVTQLGLVVPF